MPTETTPRTPEQGLALLQNLGAPRLQKRGKASTVPAPIVDRTLQALPRRARDALTRTIDAFLERAAP